MNVVKLSQQIPNDVIHDIRFPTVYCIVVYHIIVYHTIMDYHIMYTQSLTKKEELQTNSKPLHSKNDINITFRNYVLHCMIVWISLSVKKLSHTMDF